MDTTERLDPNLPDLEDVDCDSTRSPALSDTLERIRLRAQPLHTSHHTRHNSHSTKHGSLAW